MRSWVLAFLCGIVILEYFSNLPSLFYCYGFVVTAIILFYFRNRYWCYLRLVVACLIGFAWMLWVSQCRFDDKIPNDNFEKPLHIIGYVASLPVATIHGTQFLFSLKKLNDKPARGLVRLIWQHSDSLSISAGDQWQLSVRLKKPYGMMNPGGFDYEAFAFQADIQGSGYVISTLETKHLASQWYYYPLARMRQYIKQKITSSLPISPTSHWITALTIGERNNVTADDWQILRSTGTNHLMAIAGLHIGFMALLADYLVASVWRRIPFLTLRIPALYAGSVAALIMALFYSALAGFSIPTQRASIMLAVFLGATLIKRQLLAWQGWSIALLCVLLINPLCVLTESFWLSFGSVSLIIYGISGRLNPTGLWWKWGRTQWVIAIGVIPLSLWLFQECSFISFIANSIAIPLVGFIVVPLSLLGVLLVLFSEKYGGLVLFCADKTLGVLWKILTWFAHLPGVVWYQSGSHSFVILFAMIAILFLLLPRGFPGRLFSVIWFMPLVLFKPATPKFNEVWLSLLDVGQGLSAIVQTQKHILVFDTGPRFSASYDMGNSVVVPFLHTVGANRVDMLVVSHGDNDHIGGAQALLKQFSVTAIKTSVPNLLPNASYCSQGISWNWDGAVFEFLYPDSTQLNLKNDSSCVLRITVGDKHILLTGDIEKLAEQKLLDNESSKLRADIIIAPHHGSKTSAEKKFVKAVNPRYVLYPLGYHNRYHFPHASVVATYKEISALQYDTAHSGTIQFYLHPDTEITAPSLYRLNHKYYWNN